MRKRTFFLGLVLLAATDIVAQTVPPMAALDELDQMIGDPASATIVSPRAYRKLIFRDQQAIGGSVLREGRAVGSSVTIAEKGVTLNLGLGPWAVWRGAVALQPTLRGQSEAGFVNVFRKGEYSNTLSFGGTVLYFFPFGTRNVFNEQTRIDLHRELRTRRNKQGRNFDNFESEASAAPLKPEWSNPQEPRTDSAWRTEYVSAAEKFVQQRWQMQEQQRTDSIAQRDATVDQTAKRASTAKLRQVQGLYQEAAGKVARHLPEIWPGWSAEPLDAWIAYNFTPAGKVRPDFVRSSRLAYNAKVVAVRLKTYDSLQLQAPWVRRARVWFSATALGNVVRQPLFDATQPTKAYKRDYDDNFFDGQAAMNGVLIHGWGKQYGSLGMGWVNKRNFDKSQLVTYQYQGTPPPGSGSAMPIKQAEVYPDVPPETCVSNVQAQYAIYSQKYKLGLDLTARQEWGNDYQDRFKATAGVFFAIEASGSTLLFMPQVRWATVDAPDEFTFGFNLSAAIPSFLTKDK